MALNVDCSKDMRTAHEGHFWPVAAGIGGGGEYAVHEAVLRFKTGHLCRESMA